MVWFFMVYVFSDGVYYWYLKILVEINNFIFLVLDIRLKLVCGYYRF